MSSLEPAKPEKTLSSSNSGNFYEQVLLYIDSNYFSLYLSFLSALCSPPCQNGGQCDNSGTCVCLPGFTGEACEQCEF